MYDPSQPPLIEETLLKSRRSLEELAHRRSITVAKTVTRKRVIRGEDIKIKRPEQFVREHRIQEGSQRKMERRQRDVERRRHAKVPPGSIKDTVGFVIRIHEGRHSSKPIKKALMQMELIEKYDGVFMHLDEDCIKKLKPYDAYVVYGYISNKSVIELVHRRAYLKDGQDRKALSDNITVENALGEHGLLCLSDLSHEIHSVGPHFKEAIKILAPFKLSAPVGHYEKKILKINDEVEKNGGFLGDEMEAFLNKIL